MITAKEVLDIVNKELIKKENKRKIEAELKTLIIDAANNRQRSLEFELSELMRNNDDQVKKILKENGYTFKCKYGFTNDCFPRISIYIKW